MEAKINDIDRKMTKLLDKIKNIEESNREINSNTIVLNEKLEQMNKELNKVKKTIDQKEKDVKELKKTTDFLLAENRSLKNEIKEIRKTNEEMAYKIHENELDIVGIGNSTSEEVQESILHACNNWKLKINKTDIISVEQKQMKKNNEKFFRIKLNNEKNRSDLLIAARRAKNKRKDLNLADSKQYVFFNEVLTSYGQKLLFLARNLKKQQGWKYVWTKNGKIYLRKEDKTPAILITSVDEIEVLKEESTANG